jgi:hypothetical protein
MSANKIKKPILLIHGEQDNNSGTLTMQVKSYATTHSQWDIIRFGQDPELFIVYLPLAMQQQQQSLLVQNKSGRLEMKPTRPEKQRQNKGEKKGENK